MKSEPARITLSPMKIRFLKMTSSQILLPNSATLPMQIPAFLYIAIQILLDGAYIPKKHFKDSNTFILTIEIIYPKHIIRKK